ncbi:extensin [Streptomyces sp. 7R007]
MARTTTPPSRKEESAPTVTSTPRVGLGAPLSSALTPTQTPAAPTAPRRPSLGAPLTPLQAPQTPASRPPTIQRAAKLTKPKPRPRNNPTPNPAHTATSALAAAAAATVAGTLPTPATPRVDSPPPYTPTTTPPPPYTAVPVAASASAPPSAPPPPYTPTPANTFDPRDLTDFQLDELVHRIIGRITRLIRTELRLDRERVGRLRDPRN